MPGGGVENAEVGDTASTFFFFGFFCSLLLLIWPLAIVSSMFDRMQRSVEPAKGLSIDSGKIS
jgi:hypothetical protein